MKLKRDPVLTATLVVCALITTALGVHARAQKLLPSRIMSTQRESGDSSFVKWAKYSMVPISTVAGEPHREDLSPLGRIIGNATIVALSEGVHFGAEPLEFRNRILQYLVQEKGFTAIAIESGLVESRIVHDYVRGGPGDLSTVMARGIGWTFDRLPQNRAMVRWLREYNADSHRARKINFYGFDVSGSPGNPSANRGVETALVEVLEYLAMVDSEASEAFHARLDSVLENLRFDLRRSADAPGYDRLGPAERDVLTATISDLVTLLERREAQYTAATTANDYEWAHRSAIGARQTDSWLRQIPLAWRPSSRPVSFPSEATRFLSVATDVRDRAQADNLEWIVRREGSAGKVLIFAHRYHLSSVPVKTRFWLPDGADQHEQEVTGTYLRRRFAERLVTIGQLIGDGEIGCGGFKKNLKRAPPESIDGLAGELAVSRFLLDLRTAPASVADWLDRERQIGQGYDALKMVIGHAFDVLFYIDTVTPACD